MCPDAAGLVCAGLVEQEKKEIERRKRAGDDRGWNSSFLRSKTVVDAVADRLGVEKGETTQHKEAMGGGGGLGFLRRRRWWSSRREG